MANYIATATVGLEDEAVAEIAALALTATGRGAGVVEFEGPEYPSSAAVDLLLRLNFRARGLDRVGIALGSGSIESIGDCVDLADAVDFDQVIGKGNSFAVRASRRGMHDFGSEDLARAVGAVAVRSCTERLGVRPRVALDNPDVIVRADVVDDSLRLWLDGTGDEALYRRGYRRQLHPASLRSTLVHPMLQLAGWRGEPLLDPMTGIGTIPIEAALYARGIPPGRFRSVPFAIERAAAALGCVPEGREPVVGAALVGAEEPLDIRGLERFAGHVQGAWLNLAAAGPLPGTRITKGDARRIEKYVPVDHYGLAVLNPPFGRRVGSTGSIAALYSGFAASASRCGVHKIVCLVENEALMGEALAASGYTVVSCRSVLYGDLRAHVIVARGDR